LEILEYCGGETHPDNVIEREQYFLDLFKPEYNILQVARSSLGYKHLKETRAKIRAKALNQKSCVKVEVIDLETDTKTIYNSLSEAARALNTADRVISQYFTRGAKLLRPQKKPYKGRYILGSWLRQQKLISAYS
jgi:hypothetical protein